MSNPNEGTTPTPETLEQRLQLWAEDGIASDCSCATAYKGQHQGDADCPVTKQFREAAAALASQREEIERLKGLLATALEQHEAMGETLTELRTAAESRLAEQTATVERLREQLKRYGQHEDGCEAWPIYTGYITGATRKGPCTCGLDAALTERTAP